MAEQPREKDVKRRRKRRQRRKPRVVSLRVRILAACVQRETTIKEIADREGLRISTVRHHFEALEKEGYLRVSRKEPARGSRRHYYVAVRSKVITDLEFAEMKKDEKRAASEAVLRDLLASCGQALKAGTLDARADSHLSWRPLALDKQGWEEIQVNLDWLLDRSVEIQAEARDRLRKSGEDPIPTTLALAGFEAPAPPRTLTDAG